MNYSFCEAVTATSFSKWHIRRLSRVGQKFGGGADTPALCGRKVSWDLKAEVNPEMVDDWTCFTCREIYKDEVRK